MRKGYLDLAAGQLHYREAGDPSKVAIVFLHQTPSSSVMFESLMARLHTTFYCFAPDLPGFGESTALTDKPSIRAYADTVAEALELKGIRHGYVFGHHTGAAVAVQLAFNHSALANRLALSGPTLLSDALKKALPEKAKAFPADEEGSHLTQMWQRMRAKDPAASLALTERETLLGLALGEDYPLAYEAVIAHDFGSQLAAITCPVLVFCGDKDPLYSCLEPSYQLLQKGQKAVLKDIGSYACERRDAEIAALLEEFFGGGRG